LLTSNPQGAIYGLEVNLNPVSEEGMGFLFHCQVECRIRVQIEGLSFRWVISKNQFRNEQVSREVSPLITRSITSFLLPC